MPGKKYRKGYARGGKVESGPDPTTPAGGNRPAKQVAEETLPSRFAKTTITGGDPMRRTINDYAKNSPADASGEGQIGYNLHSMGRT